MSEQILACPGCGTPLVATVAQGQVALHRHVLPVPRLTATAFRAQIGEVMAPGVYDSDWERSKMLQDALNLLDPQALDEGLIATTARAARELADPLWRADALLALAHYALEPIQAHAFLSEALASLRHVELDGDANSLFAEVLSGVAARLSTALDDAAGIELRPQRLLLRAQAHDLIAREPEYAATLRAILNGQPYSLFDFS